MRLYRGCREGDCYYLTKEVSAVAKIVSPELSDLFLLYDLQEPPETPVEMNLDTILPYLGGGKW